MRKTSFLISYCLKTAALLIFFGAIDYLSAGKRCPQVLVDYFYEHDVNNFAERNSMIREYWAFRHEILAPESEQLRSFRQKFKFEARSDFELLREIRDCCLSVPQIAEIFEVSHSLVNKWLADPSKVKQPVSIGSHRFPRLRALLEWSADPKKSPSQIKQKFNLSLEQARQHKEKVPEGLSAVQEHHNRHAGFRRPGNALFVNYTWSSYFELLSALDPIQFERAFSGVAKAFSNTKLFKTHGFENKMDFFRAFRGGRINSEHEIFKSDEFQDTLKTYAAQLSEDERQKYSQRFEKKKFLVGEHYDASVSLEKNMAKVVPLHEKALREKLKMSRLNAYNVLVSFRRLGLLKHLTAYLNVYETNIHGMSGPEDVPPGLKLELLEAADAFAEGNAFLFSQALELDYMEALHIFKVFNAVGDVNRLEHVELTDGERRALYRVISVEQGDSKAFIGKLFRADLLKDE